MGSNIPTAPAPDAPTLQESDVRALTVEAGRAARSEILARLDDMFESADDLLFEFSRKSTDSAQRTYFDAMRMLRLLRGKVVAVFAGHLSTSGRLPGPDPAAVELDPDQLTLVDTSALEENLAVEAMATQSDSRDGELLRELGLRLETIAAPATALQWLAPKEVAKAFQASLAAFEVEFPIKLVVYKLFDRSVMHGLRGAYVAAIGVFEVRGIRPAKPSRVLPRPAPLPPAPAVEPILAAMDPQTMTYLATVGAAPIPLAGLGSGLTGAVDAALAHSLISAGRGMAVSGYSAPQLASMVQRASLVGRMFNDILRDPNLPSGVAEVFGGLRFSVIKTALAEPRFFADTTHPVRALVNELAVMAAATRAGGPEARHRFARFAEQVKDQFDISAETIPTATQLTAPLDGHDIEQFLDQQLAQGKERRRAIVDKVRQVVAQELELRTITQPIPDTVAPLLRSGWGPMMAMRLLRHGHDSELWRAGMELLHRVLFALNPAAPNARSPAQRAALRQDLAAALTEVGMGSDRIDAMLRGMDAALDAVESPETSAPPGADASGDTGSPPPQGGPHTEPPAADDLPSPHAFLDHILTLGSWFRVFDRSSDRTRWLKVQSWHPRFRRTTFTEFDGGNVLTLSSAELFEDVMAGRTEPIDITPGLLSILRGLRERHAAEARDLAR